MRYIIFFIAAAGLLSCQTNSPQKENKQINFDWLLGEWVRTNETEGKQTFESWEKINDSTYHSHGYTLQGQDTVWQEWVEISSRNGDIYLQARMKDEAETTDFLITSLNDSSFISNNPENEFPKEIKYWMDGDILKAEISDGDMRIPYEFVRK